jgi:hypothetical protein
MIRLLWVLLSPVVFLISLPIEVPVWRQYRREGYDVGNYLKFFWYRCVALWLPEPPSYYKKK